MLPKQPMLIYKLKERVRKENKGDPISKNVLKLSAIAKMYSELKKNKSMKTAKEELFLIL